MQTVVRKGLDVIMFPVVLFLAIIALPGVILVEYAEYGQSPITSIKRFLGLFY